MIDLTPLDVRNKRGDFRKNLRGYDAQEVDTFLELVAERLDELVMENLRLRERTDALQSQVESQTGREKAVQEALVTAQSLRAEMREQAEREAEVVLSEARTEGRRLQAEAEAEARALLRDAERRLQEATVALEELERRRLRFLRAYRQLLEREMDVVQVEEERAPMEDTPIELDLLGGLPGRTTAEDEASPPAGSPGEPEAGAPHDSADAGEADGAGELPAEAQRPEDPGVSGLGPEDAAQAAEGSKDPAPGPEPVPVSEEPGAPSASEAPRASADPDERAGEGESAPRAAGDRSADTQENGTGARAPDREHRPASGKRSSPAEVAREALAGTGGAAPPDAGSPGPADREGDRTPESAADHGPEGLGPEGLDASEGPARASRDDGGEASRAETSAVDGPGEPRAPAGDPFPAPSSSVAGVGGEEEEPGQGDGEPWQSRVFSADEAADDVRELIERLDAIRGLVEADRGEDGPRAGTPDAPGTGASGETSAGESDPDARPPEERREDTGRWG